MITDLRVLPFLRDSMDYVYIEHASIVQKDSSIIVLKQTGAIPVPVSSLTCLMLGPGVNITYAAVKAAADAGCVIVWCGDRGSRFYAFGEGETRSAKNVLKQAKYCMDNNLHMEVVRRMYILRFPTMPCEGMTLQQLRGLEGVRVRTAYKNASKLFGIQWKSRDYKISRNGKNQKELWENADPVNRALSACNFI